MEVNYKIVTLNKWRFLIYLTDIFMYLFKTKYFTKFITIYWDIPTIDRKQNKDYNNNIMKVINRLEVR